MERLAHLPACIVFYRLSTLDRACLALSNRRFCALQHQWRAHFEQEIKAAGAIQRCWRRYFNLNTDGRFARFIPLFINAHRRTSFRLESIPMWYLNRLLHISYPLCSNILQEKHVFAVAKRGDLLRRIRVRTNAPNIVEVHLILNSTYPHSFGLWTFAQPRETCTFTMCLPILRCQCTSLSLIVSTLPRCETKPSKSSAAIQVELSYAFLCSRERDALLLAQQITCKHASDADVLLRFHSNSIVDLQSNNETFASFMV